MSDFLSRLILDYYSVAGGAGVAAGAAVAVGDEIVRGGFSRESSRWGNRGLVPEGRG